MGKCFRPPYNDWLIFRFLIGFRNQLRPGRFDFRHLGKQMGYQPAQTEAQKIGDLESTDSLSACSGMKKYLARISYKLLLKNPYLDIYWEKGVYKHPKNPVLVKWFVWIRQRTAHIVQRKADTDYECRSCTLEKKSIRASGR